MKPLQIICAGCLVFMICCAPLQAESTNKSRLLNHLPDKVTNYIIKRIILQTLCKAEIELLNHMLAEKDIDPNTKQLLIKFKQSAEATYKQESISDSVPIIAKPHYIESIDLWLYDPRVLSNQVHAMEKELKQACKNYSLAKDQEKKYTAVDLEIHNFLVFYMRNVHKLCGSTVQWKPTGVLPDIDTFYSFFKSPHHTKELHSYLENINNKPFLRPDNYSLTLYFRYLELAYETRYVKMVLQEFLVRRQDLIARFPEIKFIHSVLASLRNRQLI